MIPGSDIGITSNSLTCISGGGKEAAKPRDEWEVTGHQGAVAIRAAVCCRWQRV